MANPREIKTLRDQLATDDDLIFAQDFFREHSPGGYHGNSNLEEQAALNPTRSLAGNLGNTLTVISGFLQLAESAAADESRMPGTREVIAAIQNAPVHLRHALAVTRERLNELYPDPGLYDQADMHLKVIERYRDMMRDKGPDIIAYLNRVIPPTRAPAP